MEIKLTVVPVVVEVVGDVVVEVDVIPSEFIKHSLSLRCQNLSQIVNDYAMQSIVDTHSDKV